MILFVLPHIKLFNTVGCLPIQVNIRDIMQT